MKNLITVFMLLLGTCAVAKADVWKWVDTDGRMHFVDTNKAIFTWVDEYGEAHYSDTPDHEKAIAVELVWVSSGSLADVEGGGKESGSGYSRSGESAEQRAEREKAEAYYCKRATEIYKSYVNASQLYKTNDSGEREYLSKEEAAQTIAETRSQMNEFCTQASHRDPGVNPVPSAAARRSTS